MKLALSATGCNDLTSHKKCAPGLKCRDTVCVLDKGMVLTYFKDHFVFCYYSWVLKQDNMRLR